MKSKRITIPYQGRVVPTFQQPNVSKAAAAGRTNLSPGKALGVSAMFPLTASVPPSPPPNHPFLVLCCFILFKGTKGRKIAKL